MKWSTEDTQQLKKMAAHHTSRKRIARELGRTVEQISNKLKTLGITAPRRIFTKEEDLFVERSREINFPWNLIAETLGRPENVVKARGRKLNLTNPRRYDVPDNDLAPRKCLRCRRNFPPENSYDFVCPPCEDTDDWKGGGGMG